VAGNLNSYPSTSNVEFSKKELKALLCDSRIKILKSLKKRRKTLAELSRELSLSKSTVHEHLTKLMEVGLVEKKVNPSRKWVYYELTEKGHSFLRSELWKFIMLVFAAVSIAGGIWEILKFTPTKHALKGEIVRAVGMDYVHLIAGIAFIAVGVLVLLVFMRSTITERFQ